MSNSEINKAGFPQMDELKQEEPPNIPKVLPVLPIIDDVTYPYSIVPLLVSEEKGIRAVEQALNGDRMLLMVAQRDQAGDNPTSKDMYEIGTVGTVIRMLKLPDQKLRVLVQGISRALVRDWDDDLPYIQARIRVLAEGYEEGRLGLRRCEWLQKRQLLECLNHSDEYVQPQSQHRADYVDRSPGPS